MYRIPQKFPASTPDKIEYACRQVADQQLHCVITFQGKINENLLFKAVRLTLDAEPVLGCKLVLDPNRPYWKRRDDLDSLTYCSIIVTDNLEAEQSAFITCPGDPCSYPLIQVKVFRSTKGVDTLCIKVDHVVADASGTRDYVYLLAATYRELQQNPAYQPAPNINGDRSFHQVFKKFNCFTKLRSLGKVSQPIPNFIGPYLKNNDTSQKTLIIRQTDPSQFAAIKNYARKHQATFNDLLLTTFCRALFDLAKPAPDLPIPLQVPIDLRRYLPAGKTGAICNLASALYPSITPVLNASFDSILNQVHQVMNTEKSHYPGLGPGLALEFSFKKSFKKSQQFSSKLFEKGRLSGRCYPMLTNMGQFDPDRLGFDDIPVTDAYMVSPLAYPPQFMVGLSTFKGAITLTAGFCESALLYSTIADLLSRMVLEIQELSFHKIS